jgi:transcriptional regulator with XRE-family HTH domain
MWEDDEAFTHSVRIPEYKPNAVDVRVGCNIRNARRHARLSLSALAALVDLNERQLHECEFGLRRTSLVILVQLGRALGVSISHFFEPLEPGGAVRRRTGAGQSLSHPHRRPIADNDN